MEKYRILFLSTNFKFPVFASISAQYMLTLDMPTRTHKGIGKGKALEGCCTGVAQTLSCGKPCTEKSAYNYTYCISLWSGNSPFKIKEFTFQSMLWWDDKNVIAASNSNKWKTEWKIIKVWERIRPRCNSVCCLEKNGHINLKGKATMSELREVWGLGTNTGFPSQINQI